jgi:hypothetical protein
VDYDFLIQKMIQLTDNTYSGSLIWHPYIEAVGMPDLKDSFALRPFDLEQADIPTDTTEKDSHISTGVISVSSNVNQSVMESTNSSRDQTKAASVATTHSLLISNGLIMMFTVVLAAVNKSNLIV